MHQLSLRWIWFANYCVVASQTSKFSKIVFSLMVLSCYQELVFDLITGFIFLWRVVICFLSGLFIDHGSPDPWAHSSQLGPGSYSSSAGSYSNSYGMHPRDSMVSRRCRAVYRHIFALVLSSWEVWFLLLRLWWGVLFICLFLERRSWYSCFSISKGSSYSPV